VIKIGKSYTVCQGI